MRKSKFLKKLGKISDYIFGFGDNEHWNEETAFYREFREEEDLKSGLKYIETKKTIDRCCKNFVDLAHLASISQLLEKNYESIYAILLLELFGFASHKIYRSKWELNFLKKIEKTNVTHKHQTLDEIRDEYDKRLEARLYRNE